MTTGQILLTTIQFFFLAGLVIIAGKFIGDAVVRYASKKSVENVEKDPRAQSKRSREVLSYAKSVNLSLSCLESDLSKVAKPNNVHTCEMG